MTNKTESTKPNKRQLAAIWINGDDYEYEFAYCSRCGRKEYAGWNTHAEAKDKVEHFHEDYRYCPGCGAHMMGGHYREKKGKNK